MVEKRGTYSMNTTTTTMIGRVSRNETRITTRVRRRVIRDLRNGAIIINSHLAEISDDMSD
jgi:hypothetical protein